MKYNTFLVEDRRLLILRMLAGQPDYTLNDGLLMRGLERLGHRVTRAALLDDLDWLVARNLVTLEVLSEQMTRTELAEQGLEVAEGKRVVGGIRRLRPADKRTGEL